MAIYRAMQVEAPGRLELVEHEVPEPAAGEVLIAVEACGICGADRGTVEATAGGLALPRVPGHEVAGRISALGPGVARWRVGQRVGVGRFGGHCGACPQCRDGRFVMCEDQPVVGVTRDGGYAEMMTARSTGLVSIPEEIDAADAAPLMCAGLATFNALRRSGADAGDLVAVQGIGGLGHLALQYARGMGFEVAAISRGPDKANDARSLGAHHYVDAAREDPAQALQDLGGASVVLTTGTDGAAVSALFPGLEPRGRLIVAGITGEPLSIPAGKLVAGERTVAGSITGSPAESEQALGFSVRADIRPRVEAVPLERAHDAYRRMAEGAARYRMVLTMNGGG